MSIEIREHGIFANAGGNFQVTYTSPWTKGTCSEWKVSLPEAILRGMELDKLGCTNVKVHQHWHVPKSELLGTCSGGSFVKPEAQEG